MSRLVHAVAKIVSGMLVVATCMGLTSTAHAEVDAHEAAHPHVVQPQLTVGGPVATGIRTVVRVVNDPELFADSVVGKTPSAGSSRVPTWVGPEFQKPQYQTTLLELTF
jgi:hypothetical protein